MNHQIKMMNLRKINELDRNYNPTKISLDINRYVEKWNRDFPWDYWWRKKNKVSFGSRQHREMDLIDMLIEYVEEKYMERRAKKLEEENEMKEDSDLGLEIGKTNLKMSVKQTDEAFEKLNLEEFN